MFTLVVLMTLSTTVSPPLEQQCTWHGETVLGALCFGNVTFAKYLKMYPNLAKS